MTKEIKSVAVLGGGTMGAGIAGLCAERDIKVLILEINQDAVDAAKDRLLNGIPAPIDNPEKMANIETGTFDKDLEKLKNYDWICEAIIENAEAKRGLIKRVEEVRSDHTILTSNTSGISCSNNFSRNLGDVLDIIMTGFVPLSSTSSIIPLTVSPFR